MPQPHQLRVIAERNELAKKYEKLEKFITLDPIFETLELEEQSRLDRQLYHMGSYLRVLGERIAAFEKE